MFGRRAATSLELRLGYRFRRPELLDLALTHPSHAHEADGPGDYERLEFLGDAVLGAVAAEWLYASHPELPEGELSKLKSFLVAGPALAGHARDLGLGEGLRLGVGEERSGGRDKDSLLADALEAVFGGIFLDGGFEAARAAIQPLLVRAVAARTAPAAAAYFDAKTRLQEVVQARGWELPRYELAGESGPDHEKTFTIECRIEGHAAARGEGRSKKIAEQVAAAAVLARPARIPPPMTDAPLTAAAPPAPATPAIRDLARFDGREIALSGWLENKRSSGKIGFLQVRDGSGVVQAVASRADLSPEAWAEVERATQESTVRLRGTVKADPRAPGGVELQLADFAVTQLTEDYPITPKEHGTAFLMEHRHLWLRSRRQRAALRVRSEVEQAIRDFFYTRDYVLIDSPILTPAACEGTSTLFETDYFGDKAYLSQSGQLYLEPAAAALGKVYCFGPTFRAEKSKTRRHLTEFWMVEPEVAFLEFDGLCALAEEFVCELVGRVLDRAAEDLKVLERDTAALARVQPPFPRLTYTEAIEILRGEGQEIAWGDDFGAEHETLLGNRFDRPVMVTRFPASMKAFYMQPAPEDPKLALGLDLLAPEGYGEIVGGSQRIHDHDLLYSRLVEHNLPIEAFQWYLDIRKYGGFPHSGFGMGLERFVSWMGGLTHLREAIPYPRMLYRIYP